MAKNTKAKQLAKTRTVKTTTILGLGNFVTGVRGMSAGGDVVLTGNQVTDGVQTPMLYTGPISPTDTSEIHLLTPQIKGVTVTGATFYGPDTPLFNPKIGKGNVRAVGSCLLAGGEARNHGLLYEGPPTGGGRWSLLDVPARSIGGQKPWNTLAHSTMGDLVVGNYDLKGEPGSGNAFIYNLVTRRWTIFDLGTAGPTSAYGIWQIARGGTKYVIVGGARDGQGFNRGLMVNYDSKSGAFSDLTLYSAFNVTTLMTHFEGITAVPGGYHLAGMTLAGEALFVDVPVNGDGSFGAASWVPFRYTGATVTTGNTIYRNTLMGIYVSDSGTVQSYAATFK